MYQTKRRPFVQKRRRGKPSAPRKFSQEKVILDEFFSVIVNLGPGSFSRIRTSLAIAKGLEISKNVQLYGYKDTDLKEFDEENVEKLLKKYLIEKKLIKPIYLS